MSRRKRDFVTARRRPEALPAQLAAGIRHALELRWLETIRALHAQGSPIGNALVIAQHAAAGRGADVAGDRRSPVPSENVTATPDGRDQGA